LAIFSSSNKAGFYSSILVANSSIIYSLDLPPVVDAFDEIDNIVDSKYLVSYYEFDISAFSCNPNASGDGFSGRSLI